MTLDRAPMVQNIKEKELICWSYLQLNLHAKNHGERMSNLNDICENDIFKRYIFPGSGNPNLNPISQEAGAGGSLWVWDHPCLQCEFQDTQSCTEKPCLKEAKQNKPRKKLNK